MVSQRGGGGNFKDKQMSPTALRVLSRVKPVRQIEICELMVAAHNYTVPFARALLAATPKNQLAEAQKRKRDLKASHRKKWPAWKGRPTSRC